MQLSITPAPPSLLKKRPPFDENLGFGNFFSDHWFVMEYSDGFWNNPRIEAMQPLSLHPASMGLHYGQLIFEGLKAYRKNESIFLFRPEENFKRMNRSAHRLVMPSLDTQFVLDALTQLLILEQKWIPQTKGYALYIRPTMVATEPRLRVKPSEKYTFFIILSPVGAYYPKGMKPISIYVTDEYARAAVGGCGEAKAAGNYAASLLAQQKGAAQGCEQVLWLDSAEKRYIEEVGAMNLFIRFKDTIVTPSLSGAILPGITRDSVIQILKKWNLPLVERSISLEELLQGIKKEEVLEVFGTGTAAVISSVGMINYNGKKYTILDGEIGSLTQKLYNYLTDLQQGNIEDSFGFKHSIQSEFVS
jgi:branched-chain amino acid aminotransferase